MSERVRHALFNMLGDMRGMVVCDAFAGTGALGLEAISRGAQRVVCIERDRVAQKVLAENVARLGVEERVDIIRASVTAWTETTEPILFDYIFADPPYHDVQLAAIARLAPYLKQGGYLMVSYPTHDDIPKIEGFALDDVRVYGDATLLFFTKPHKRRK
jgi:16S rRNA (guanine966-N2)-methyltransferase